MGKAQKLKAKKKQEEQRRAEERRRRRQRRLRVAAVLLAGLLAAAVAGVLVWLLWPESFKYQEMVLETSRGEVRIELLGEAAPQTVQRMTELVDEGFYAGIRFHRVLDDIAQAGDPQSKNPDADLSTLGTQGSGKTFSNEIDFGSEGFADDVNNYFGAEGAEVGRAILEAGAAEEGVTVDQLISQLESQGTSLDQVLQSWNDSGLDYNQALATLYAQRGYTYETATESALMGEGMVAMANTAPQPVIGSDGQIQTDANGQPQWDSNINDSQFFIIRHYDTGNLSELLWRYKHTVFGRVVSGMDVVSRLQQGDTIDKAYIYTENRHR